MHGLEGMGFGMGWWWIIGLIFLAVIIWGIVRSTAQNKNTNNTVDQKSALNILTERYARGEIDKEEFEQRKKDLM
jgi:putative membrane protein